MPTMPPLPEPYKAGSKEADLWELFCKFDTDGSGEIDTNELEGMIESLGMTVKADELDRWIKEADTSGDGELQFDEFLGIINKAATKQESGLSLSAIIARSKNSRKMQFRADKLGPGVSVSTEKSENDTATSSGGGWGVVALDEWLSVAGNDHASVLLEIKELGGSIQVGVVGKNFNSGDWGAALDKEKVAVVWSSEKGVCYAKGGELGQEVIAASMAAGMRVQLEISTRSLGLTLNLLKEKKVTGEVKKGQRTTEWYTHSEVKLNDGLIKHEVAVAVAFGGEGKSVVSVVGSSSSKTEKQDEYRPAVSKELESANSDPVAAAAMSM